VSAKPAANDVPVKAQQKSDLDLERLADKVYRLLLEDLRLSYQRSGHGSAFRGLSILKRK
jgi:hypothetical protein